METEQVAISGPFGFISALLTSLKFDNAKTLRKQAVSVLQQIDSKIGEVTKASLMKELKRVLMENQALHSIEQVKLGTSSSAQMFVDFNPIIR